MEEKKQVRFISCKAYFRGTRRKKKKGGEGRVPN